MDAEARTYQSLAEEQAATLDRVKQEFEQRLQTLQSQLDASQEILATVLHKARFWEKHATTILNSRQQLMLNKLLDGFEGKMNTSKWAKMTKTSPDTALRDIQDLLNKKVLVKEVGGGRSTNYSLPIIL